MMTHCWMSTFVYDAMFQLLSLAKDNEYKWFDTKRHCFIVCLCTTCLIFFVGMRVFAWDEHICCAILFVNPQSNVRLTTVFPVDENLITHILITAFSDWQFFSSRNSSIVSHVPFLIDSSIIFLEDQPSFSLTASCDVLSYTVSPSTAMFPCF